MSDLIDQGYTDFLAQIKLRIRQKQYQALRAVNSELVSLYWEIGETSRTSWDGAKLS